MNSTIDSVELDRARYASRTGAEDTTTPAPANAEAMLQALIKSNQSERDIVQSDIDELTKEANRLDTIREGLQGALRAARASALRSVVQGPKPPCPPSPPPPPASWARG